MKNPFDRDRDVDEMDDMDMNMDMDTDKDLGTRGAEHQADGAMDKAKQMQGDGKEGLGTAEDRLDDVGDDLTS